MDHRAPDGRDSKNATAKRIAPKYLVGMICSCILKGTFSVLRPTLPALCSRYLKIINKSLHYVNCYHVIYWSNKYQARRLVSPIRRGAGGGEEMMDQLMSPCSLVAAGRPTLTPPAQPPVCGRESRGFQVSGGPGVAVERWITSALKSQP
jgi:hypothetical protein